MGREKIDRDDLYKVASEYNVPFSRPEIDGLIEIAGADRHCRQMTKK